MFIKDILDILLYIHSNIYTYVIAYIYIYIYITYKLICFITKYFPYTIEQFIPES